MDIKVAVLVDGSFFIKRVQFHRKKYFHDQPELTGKQMAEVLMSTVRRHLNPKNNKKNLQKIDHYLHRIYYYDAPPLAIKLHYPLPDAPGEHCKVLDYKNAPQSLFRSEFLTDLKKQRKVAVRLGTTKHDKQWKLTDFATKSLIKGELTSDKLQNSHFYHEVRQKGVDIKLGIDIASLAYEKQVDKIILVAGDSDFVPAAKLARIHGIDFVLDPLRNNIDPRLHEHIDGLVGHDLVGMLKDILKVDPIVLPEWWKNKSDNRKVKKVGSWKLDVGSKS